jgi:hypothetical protein
MKYVVVCVMAIAAFAALADDADEPTQLDPLVVEGKRELQIVPDDLPCLGCDGKPQGLPLGLTLSRDVTLFAAGAFFQKPRVRGEPNDEAAYYALRSAQCTDDSPGCIDRHPNPSLFNWEPTNTRDDAILSRSNSVLVGE